MSDTTNEGRAQRGYRAVMACHGPALARTNTSDHRDAIVDTLADILHYARAIGFSGADVFALASAHYEAEREEVAR